jgi:hypothetical protein
MVREESPACVGNWPSNCERANENSSRNITGVSRVSEFCCSSRELDGKRRKEQDSTYDSKLHDLQDKSVVNRPTLRSQPVKLPDYFYIRRRTHADEWGFPHLPESRAKRARISSKNVSVTTSAAAGTSSLARNG